VAGSWDHMTTKSGKLRNNESFCDMVENLGDAYEAAEECYGMVYYLARQVANMRTVYGSFGQTVTREEVIREAQDHYKEGLRLGGVQRNR